MFSLCSAVVLQRFHSTNHTGDFLSLFSVSAPLPESYVVLFLGLLPQNGCDITLLGGKGGGCLYSTDTLFWWFQFSSVTQSCPTLCDPMDCSTPGLPVHHQLLELAQTHVYWVGDTIQPSHPLLSPSPPTFNLPQHQGLFKWVSSLHQVAKVLEFQLQHQSFQWIFRTDFL